MMKTKIVVLLALVALGVLFAIGPAAADNISSPGIIQDMNNIQPYTGPIGPDSALYGLKLAFENLGDTFTFNQTQRLDQEINHTETRLSELESALAANQTDAANLALDQYWQDTNRTQKTLAWFNDTGFLPGSNGTYDAGGSLLWFNGTYNGRGNRPGPDDAALVAAQQRILLHQAILEDLLATHPGNPGLARAYNSSRDLAQGFEDMARQQYNLTGESGHGLVFRHQFMNATWQNQTTPDSWNQTWANSSATDNGQSPGPTNLVWQDQHQQDARGNSGHNLSPGNGQEDQGNPNGKNNGQNNGNNYGNNNRNGNRGLTFHGS
jgi:hypothetical protein